MIKTILFICSANKQRSKTAEDYFSSKYVDFNFISAGTNIKMCEREGTNPLTINLLEQSDLIFVMENSHKKDVKNFINGEFKKDIIVLNIPDLYKYYQQELIEILEDKITSYLK
ncbi:phosphotyrosine protein phosphatase [Flavobacterium sp. xlx-214]|uniref:phosphotyrosine protein phosphatase n=1 Tax=unclassified Flavobacterium TaxID=196869 RepID=UPI0013D55670|nr:MULTISPECIES: phosphotyrosine protein phosphatase [unclassified Flavobacterium]MBA5791745.1 phosphotyrosine protein phosphatase [Flavobacterium sp. xlx-221]QMI82984.1 phosphotyrosine protein phosphatase [Flavobacterium sp. xlx-214]